MLREELLEILRSLREDLERARFYSQDEYRETRLDAVESALISLLELLATGKRSIPNGNN